MARVLQPVIGLRAALPPTVLEEFRHHVGVATSVESQNDPKKGHALRARRVERWTRAPCPISYWNSACGSSTRPFKGVKGLVVVLKQARGPEEELLLLHGHSGGRFDEALEVAPGLRSSHFNLKFRDELSHN